MGPWAPLGAQNDARKRTKPKKAKTRHPRIFLSFSCRPRSPHFRVFLDPGGSFWDFPGGPGKFWGGPGPPQNAPGRMRNRARDPFWAPVRMLGPLWVDLGSIWSRFGVDLGVDFGTIWDPFGMHFGTILDPSEEFCSNFSYSFRELLTKNKCTKPGYFWTPSVHLFLA